MSTTPRPLRVLVVDDEPLARERLRDLLGTLPGIDIVGEAADGSAAIECCRLADVDLVLLDIRMPGLDGLKTAGRLARLPVVPGIVFLTAYDDRAIDAFDTGAIDYLLKPVRMERLVQALERVRRLRPVAAPGGDGVPRHFVVRRASGIVRVPVDDVLCLRAEDKYVCLVTAGDEHLIESSLASIEREHGARFLRIHRNCLVAADRVRALHRDGDGEEHVRIEGIAEALPVSRRNLAGVRARLLHDA